MRDKHDRLTGGGPDRFEFDVQAVACQCIKRTEGFVHEQDGRVNGQSSCDSHPLAHAAGELVHVAMLKAFQMYQLNETPGFRRPFPGREASLAQAKLDIVLDVQPGKEGRFLEEQDTVSARSAHFTPVGPDGTPTGSFQSCDDAEQGGVATAARSKEADERACTDVSVKR